MSPQEERDHYIFILTQFGAGEEIQALIQGGPYAEDKWIDVIEPSWNFDRYTYRVKPGPTKYVLDEDGTWSYYDGESTLVSGQTLTEELEVCD